MSITQMSKYNIFDVANEAIDFQDKTFGKELEAFFTDILATCKTGKDIADSNKSHILSAIIKKHTNLILTVDLVSEQYGLGPCIQLPEINLHHIFTQPGSSYLFPNTPSQEFITSIKKYKAKSGVDLHTGKVKGVYSEVGTTMYFPPNYLLKYNLTAAEITGITLHEIGHLFTYFEFFDRVDTNNQILVNLSYNFTKAKDNNEREEMIKLAAEAINLKLDNPSDLAKLDSATMAAVFLKESSENTKSGVGNNTYDRTSCEALADQYASRHGYGREVALGLDKLGFLWVSNNATMRAILYYSTTILLITRIGVLSFAAIAGAPLGLVILLSLMNIINVTLTRSDLKDHTYDTTSVRLKRIREQLIQITKNPKICKEEINRITTDIKNLDILIAKTVEFGGFLTVIADFFSTKGTNAAKSISLQRKLEELAHNDLFLSAAKIKHAL